MRYEVRFKESVRKDVRRLPASVARRLRAAIESLRDDPRPRGALSLRGHPDHYRLRVGRYRVLYRVADGACVILVIKIAHRRQAYRGW